MKSITQMKVRDVMSRGVVTVNMDAPVREIAKTLVDENISGVAVVAPDNEIMGVVSEMDIIKVFDQDLNKLNAENIMSSFVKTIKPDMTLEDAAKIMKESNIHRLLVLHGSPGKSHDIPIGILTASDILKAIVESR